MGDDECCVNRTRSRAVMGLAVHITPAIMTTISKPSRQRISEDPRLCPRRAPIPSGLVGLTTYSTVVERRHSRIADTRSMFPGTNTGRRY